MRAKIDRLSNTLKKILQARGMEGRLREYRVFGEWEKAVGAVIARHAHPSSLRGKKMTLIVDSPAWMQQLSLLKPEIIMKINLRLGHNSIKDITLRLGEIKPCGSVSEEISVHANLDREEREKIGQALHGIHDPEVREAVRRVMEKDLLSRKERKK